ncbi:MAG: MBL fold metallo-hydrolase [Pseudomonadota bacterium]
MRPLSLALLALLSVTTLASEAAGLRFSLVKTAEIPTPDVPVGTNGYRAEKQPSDHIAVLIEHHAATLLLDTSLGRQVDSQFAAQAPLLAKLPRPYGPVTPARDQLDRDGIRIDRILLTDTRWNSASGLADYPEIPVWAPYEAIDSSRMTAAPSILPNQFNHGVNWVPYVFEPLARMGFSESLDLFGDGSLVLVPLADSTPGSVGLFLTLDDGRQFFFNGAVGEFETSEAREEQRKASRVTADQDAGLLVRQQLRRMTAQNPDLTIIPAHDARANQPLGYYPQWVESQIQ